MVKEFNINDLINNPDYLLHGVNPSNAELVFLEVTRDTYTQSAFLDHRISHTRGRIHGFDLGELAATVAQVPARTTPVNYIFHTSFCCSTLLARSLTLPGHIMPLREPMAITNLADSKRILQTRNQFDPATWKSSIALVVRLLNKVYTPGECVMVKPTNTANNVAGDLLRADRDSKALLMSTGLESFIASNIKKGEEAMKKVPLMSKFFSMDSDYLEHFPEISLPELGFLQRVIFIWHAQRYMFAKLQEEFGDERVRSLDADDLLSDPTRALRAVSSFMNYGLDEKEIAAINANPIWHRNAKTPNQPYNRGLRKADYMEILDQNRELVDDALAWSRLLQDRMPFDDRLPNSVLD